MHCFFKPDVSTLRESGGITPFSEALAQRHLQIWRDPNAREREVSSMRRSNAEWDFMGRTFLVLSLAEMSARAPDRSAEFLPVMDAIIEETLRLESQHGMYFFLMPYATARPYVVQPSRSLFIDSEIAAMLAARLIVASETVKRQLLCERIHLVVDSLQRNEMLGAESYPDECWTFDHAMALAAIRMADHVTGDNHTSLLQLWLSMAKERLIDPATGMLISSYTTKCDPLDGPEGSSFWFAVHALRLVDEDFAAQQYRLGRNHLRRSLCGFAWSREWPASWKGSNDIDSGAMIPVLDVGAGGSGMAFIGASSHGDREYFGQLLTTLNFAAFPERKGGSLRYCASNQVGDSVMLYASVLGPIWERILKSK